MPTRQLLILPLALFALLVLTGSVLAGGWATVTMAQPPTDPSAGDETTVEMTVLQHGTTPVDWPRITVVASNSETGAVVRSEARALSDSTGRYDATFVLPTDGAWAIAFESPDLIMEGSATLDVAVIPQVVAASAFDIGTTVGIAAIVLLAIGLALAAVVIRNRREPREQPFGSGG